ncbi:HAD family hydrolase [Halobacteriales archaeon QS_8_69_26]|nr:MAG: HAD family hydrolase [Halobacteriales archaeon QS_8_69_26]
MTLRAVGLDLDDTLAVPDRSRAAILRDAVRSVGGDDLADRIEREHYDAAHRENQVGETREGIFEALLRDRAPEADVDPAALATAYREHTAAALRPVEGATELVEELRKSYRVGLLTNGPSTAQRDKIRELGLTDAFDTIIVTGELGYPKPDRRPFEALCRDLDADPSETAYVGDSPEEDVVGAADAGLWVVQVLGEDDDPHPRGDATVRRSRLADELPGILADLDG